MLTAGLIEETQSVMNRYGDSPLLTTIGYAQAKAYLSGELPKEQIAHEIALHTRQYAKRQMTYLRNEPKKRGWKIRPTDTEDGVILDESEVGTKRTRRASEPRKGFRVMRYTEEGLVEAVRSRLREGVSGSEVWYVVVKE
jgi:hypothetical protein